MGNDIDIMSQDEEFDQIFWKSHGPKDETTYNFFKRGFNSFCNGICSPERSTYTSSQLSLDGFSTNEFTFLSRGFVLHGCEWKLLSPRKRKNGSRPKRSVLVYLHTNTRNLSDAVEAADTCRRLSMDLISFDLPGCGKSEGSLSCKMEHDVVSLVDWIRSSSSTCYDDIEFCIWGRGLSSSLAISYCSMLENKSVIRCLVLDSPFESIQKMISDCIQNFSSNGYEVPMLLIPIFSRMVRNVIYYRLHGDPYQITPITKISKLQFAAASSSSSRFNLPSFSSSSGKAYGSKEKFGIPVAILIATRDDYIPVSQGLKVAEECKKNKLACSVTFVEQGHFGCRPAESINDISKAILSFLSLEEQEISLAEVEDADEILEKMDCDNSSNGSSLQIKNHSNNGRNNSSKAIGMGIGKSTISSTLIKSGSLGSLSSL